MRSLIAASVLAFALPAFAQEPAAAPADYTFLKAFYLEKGERNFAEAIGLYEKFLAANADHALAPAAARQALQLLHRTGKADAAEAFAKKHEKLLAREVAPVAAEEPADEPPARGGAGRGGRGGGAGRGGFDPEQMQARLAQLKEELAKAKEAGDDETVARLERQIQRMEAMGRGGQGGQGGQGGRGGQGAGGRGGRGFGQPVNFSEMDAEQMDQFNQRLDRMAEMVPRIRESGNEERAKEMETGIKDLKKALSEKKYDEAQKLWDKLAQGMRRRGGG